MRGFILLSCAVCLAVARPQSGYNYGGPSAGQFQGAAQLSQPIQQAAAPGPLATANGQLDQSTLDILRQLPSVPTSSSFLLHESHQTLTNAGGNAFGNNAFSSGLNELNSAPIQAQFSGGINPIQVASSAQGQGPAPQYSPIPQFAPAPQPQSFQQFAPQQAAPAPQQSFQHFAPQQAAPAPQQSFQHFAPQAAAPQSRAPALSYGPVPQQALPQSQFAPLGPSPADIAPSHLAGSSSLSPSIASFAPSAPAPAPLSAAPLQLAPAQQPAPAQPSGLYPTANFPEPITTIHKHIYVHVPPPEFEEELPAPKVRVEPANNQKHVQILFIKAPAPPTPKPIEFPPLATNEEKTLVYVLVRKPEQPDEIVPPQTPEPKVNKPEVFFIKYQGDNQPQGYGSDAPASAQPDAGSSDATVTNAANLSEARSAEPAQSSEQSAAPSQAASDNQQLSSSSSSSASASSSSSSSSAAPDRKYIPAA